MVSAGVDSTTIIRQHGTLFYGVLAAEYYLSQPAPSQWLAVGIVGPQVGVPAGSRLKQLLMGIGETEDVAVSALHRRLAALCRLVSASGTSCVCHD